jgi:hypothetical protein
MLAAQEGNRVAQRSIEDDHSKSMFRHSEMFVFAARLQALPSAGATT